MLFGQSHSTSTVVGRFNSKLVPVGKVEMLKLDGTFQPLKFLIDTGHEHQIGIKRGLPAQYELWQDFVTDGAWSLSGIQGTGGISPTSVSRMKINWLGLRRPVDVHDLPDHIVSGQVGMAMFEDFRVTFDVEEHAKVRVGPIPRPPWYRRVFGDVHTVLPTHDLVGCESKNCGDVFAHPGLAWTEIEVMGSGGSWHRLHVFIDTGDNGELGLSSSKIRELGLQCSRTCAVATPLGVVETGVGQVRVRWQGSERSIEFNQSVGDDPPKIGTTFLRNRRITVDRFLGRTRTRISPIRRH